MKNIKEKKQKKIKINKLFLYVNFNLLYKDEII